MITLLAALFATPAMASDGIPVAVAVVDEEGNPIKSAVVRHVEEKTRHRVNMETGVWEGEAIYLMDGTEQLFVKKMLLTFEVSAPGYGMERFSYEVKKRKNVTTVTLKKLEFDTEEEEDDVGAGIQFKHDRPRD